MKHFKSGLLLASLSLFAINISAVASAQEEIVVGQQGQPVQKPHNGETMSHVEATYGEPIERTPAVGEPPITRWRYAEFTVYFENDKVIHAVTHRS